MSLYIIKYTEVLYKMEIDDVQRERAKEDRSVQMSIRTSKEKSKFMNENNISPTKLFNKAVEELMGEKPKWKIKNKDK